MEAVFCSTPIYWINLETSRDRRQAMLENLKGTNNLRIEAVDGRNNDVYYKKYKVLNPNTNFSNALNSVLCSHIRAIKKAYDNSLENVIIIEDSCHFDKLKFPHTINQVLDLVNKVDPDFDAIQLLSRNPPSVFTDQSDYIKKGLQAYKRDSFFDGLFYLINRKGMAKLLNLVPTDGDTFFDLKNISSSHSLEDMIYNNINTYMINMPMFYKYTVTATFPYYYSTPELNEMYHKHNHNPERIYTPDNL